MMRNPFPACGRHRARWSLKSPHDAASPNPPGKAVVAVVAVLANSTACGSLLQWAAVPPPRRQSSSPAEGSVAGVPPERSTPTGSATPSASTMGSPSPVPASLRAIEAPERSEHRVAVQAQSPQSNSRTIAYLRGATYPRAFDMVLWTPRCARPERFSRGDKPLTRLSASRRATLSRKGRGCTVGAA
jgi:hypothetical protein